MYERKVLNAADIKSGLDYLPEVIKINNCNLVSGGNSFVVDNANNTVYNSNAVNGTFGKGDFVAVIDFLGKYDDLNHFTHKVNNSATCVYLAMKTLRNKYENSKIIILNKDYLAKNFLIIALDDYGSQAMTPTGYEPSIKVFGEINPTASTEVSQYEKLPDCSIAILRIYNSKQAFLLIDLNAVSYGSSMIGRYVSKIVFDYNYRPLLDSTESTENLTYKIKSKYKTLFNSHYDYANMFKSVGAPYLFSVYASDTYYNQNNQAKYFKFLNNKERTDSSISDDMSTMSLNLINYNYTANQPALISNDYLYDCGKTDVAITADNNFDYYVYAMSSDSNDCYYGKRIFTSVKSGEIYERFSHPNRFAHYLIHEPGVATTANICNLLKAKNCYLWDTNIALSELDYLTTGELVSDTTKEHYVDLIYPFPTMITSAVSNTDTTGVANGTLLLANSNFDKWDIMCDTSADNTYASDNYIIPYNLNDPFIRSCLVTNEPGIIIENLEDNTYAYCDNMDYKQAILSIADASIDKNFDIVPYAANNDYSTIITNNSIKTFNRNSTTAAEEEAAKDYGSNTAVLLKNIFEAAIKNTLTFSNFTNFTNAFDFSNKNCFILFLSSSNSTDSIIKAKIADTSNNVFFLPLYKVGALSQNTIYATVYLATFKNIDTIIYNTKNEQYTSSLSFNNYYLMQ